MKRLLLISGFLALLGFVFACSSSSTKPGSVDIIKLDSEVDGDAAKNDLFQDDTDRKDLSNTEGNQGSVTDSVDSKQDTAPEPGHIGAPCKENKDCISGICIESRDGKVCTATCVDTCPDGWSCVNTNWGGDTLFICLPKFLTLCDPCKEAKDCNPSMTAGGAACIDYGPEGKFCGGDCSDGYCPEGYECKEVSVPSGTAKQCVPKSGKCECSKRAISLELSTECYVKNDYGKCTGTRKCGPSGLTECEAKEPKPEECNKIDDNCNGLTDEGLDKIPCEQTNNYGTCKGTGKCVDGQIVECNAPKPGPEKCDGFDNDCDGQTDEDTCYDGDPCTEDLCDPSTGGCVYKPLSGVKCDDGNPCTNGDHCQQGKCVGTQKNCDDGNPCTDDFCDTSNGQCMHKNNSKPCDDGNPCTLNDYCLNGQCHPGKPKQCPDNPPCKINGNCNPQTGKCDYTYNDGANCDDGDVCTEGTTCSHGICTGGHDTCQGTVCTPGQGQNICLPVKCVEVFGKATCPCVCF